MEPSAAADAFAELFPRVYRLFHVRRDKGDYRPTDEALAVLQHLRGTGPLTISELGAHLDRSQAATSDIVTRLERRGILARIEDERDRRRTLVWLTERGEAVVADAARVLEVARLADALARVPEDARAELVRGMRALVEAGERATRRTG